MFTQITKEQNMNYKQIKRHNSKEWKKYEDSLHNWTGAIYKPQTHNLGAYIKEEATSAEGMTLWDTISFHMYNPNGLFAQLPVYEDFILIDEPDKVNASYAIYTKYDNYHAEVIRELRYKRKRLKKWNVNYHLEALKKDINKARALMVEMNLKGSLKYKNSEVA